ncbi:MAG TPA: hypothetical protein VGM49_03510 [Candidatus Limnocylindrales bacterium]|jgi:hypothetical protein
MRLLAAALRMDRFEIRAIAALAVGALAVGAILAIRLLSFGIPDACLGAGALDAVCQPWATRVAAYEEAATLTGPVLLAAFALLPIFGGLLVGTSLIGKEIDERTTTFVWSVGPDRRRWLALRAFPPALLLVLATLGVGFFDDWLIWLAARRPPSELGFDLLAFRGIAPAAAALAALGIATFVGAVMGRMLPTLLLAGGFIAAALLGVAFASDRFLENETIVVDLAAAPPGRQLDTYFQTAEGELITWDVAFSRYGDDMNTWPATLRQLIRMNVYETAPLVATRMALLDGALGLAAITAAFAVVARRRP